MDAAKFIRDSVSEVDRLRRTTAADPRLAAAVDAVKEYQSVRFRHSYQDLIDSGPYRAAAKFFLDELYGLVDYSRRDAQFARIAGAIERLLPQQAIATAVALARLHVLTEQLDQSMGRVWMAAPEHASAVETYVFAWRAVGRRQDREAQLEMVLALGRDLDRLTRTAGLRLLLKMMRRPAHAAGLHELQKFLETGFDTFARLAKQDGGTDGFLRLIETREAGLMDALFNQDLNAQQLLRDAVLPRLSQFPSGVNADRPR
ncbi:hypothetical protein O4H66_09870 [Comamonadaceae bacterium G21597-S1]|nr:hypothetical protein [Comamonadaceae bacterium G21597-S1]